MKIFIFTGSFIDTDLFDDGQKNTVDFLNIFWGGVVFFFFCFVSCFLFLLLLLLGWIFFFFFFLGGGGGSVYFLGLKKPPKNYNSG